MTWQKKERGGRTYTKQVEPIDRLLEVSESEFDFTEGAIHHTCGAKAEFWLSQRPHFDAPRELPVYYCRPCWVCTYWTGPENIDALREQYIKDAEDWERMAARCRAKAAALGGARTELFPTVEIAKAMCMTYVSEYLGIGRGVK